MAPASQSGIKRDGIGAKKGAKFQLIAQLKTALLTGSRNWIHHENAFC
jgi:hypothetical protein